MDSPIERPSIRRVSGSANIFFAAISHAHALCICELSRRQGADSFHSARNSPRPFFPDGDAFSHQSEFDRGSLLPLAYIYYFEGRVHYSSIRRDMTDGWTESALFLIIIIPCQTIAFQMFVCMCVHYGNGILPRDKQQGST